MSGHSGSRRAIAGAFAVVPVLLAGPAQAAAPGLHLVARIPVRAQAVAVEPRTHTVYAVTSSSTQVTVADGRTGRVVGHRRAGCCGDYDLASDDGTLYASGIDSPLVALDERGTGRAVLPLPGPAYAVAVDPTTHRVYSTDLDSGVVYVSDGATRRLLATVPTDGAVSLALDPAAGRLYAGDAQGVAVVDLTTDTVLRHLPATPSSPVAVDRGTVYAVGDQELEELRDGRAVRTVPLPRGHLVTGIAVDGGRVLVLDSGDPLVPRGQRALLVVDPAAGRVVQQVPLTALSRPVDLAVDPVTHRVYVAGGPQVWVLGR